MSAERWLPRTHYKEHTMSKKSRQPKVADLSLKSKQPLRAEEAELVRGGKATSGQKKYMEIVLKEVVVS